VRGDTEQFIHHLLALFGNLLSGGTRTFTYAAADRLTSVNGVGYTWDDNGNLLSDGVRTYSYDAADRLIAVSGQPSAVSYTYNGDGLLVGRTVDSVGTTFTWDVAAALPQVLATSDGAAYMYGLGLLAQQQSGAWQYPLSDGLGSLRQWTDVDGQVTYAARYAPFGSLLWQQGTAPGPWGFAGEMQDPTGLIYLRARWYDPVTGRFLTRDPFPGLPVQPTTLHPYTYALNNPVLYVDPTGEFLFLPLLAVAAAGGLLGGLGYYGIQAYMQADPCTGMQWDWGEALFWGGVGTVMGAGIGVGIYGGWWVGVQLGWWGTATGGAAGYKAIEVASSKLDYLLTNPGKVGGFTRLGYASENVGALNNLLVSIGQEVTSADLLAVTQYGTKFEKAVEVVGPTGVVGRLVTVWQIDQGSNVLRFITAWVEVFK
jgi:RHS repeat-associated protein